MTVKVLFFAQCADWVNKRESSVKVDSRETFESLLNRVPDFEPLRARRDTLRAAINLEYAHLDSPVRDGDEIAFFPPVNGS